MIRIFREIYTDIYSFLFKNMTLFYEHDLQIWFTIVASGCEAWDWNFKTLKHVTRSKNSRIVSHLIATLKCNFNLKFKLTNTSNFLIVMHNVQCTSDPNLFVHISVWRYFWISISLQLPLCVSQSVIQLYFQISLPIQPVLAISASVSQCC